ncbi:MAG: family 43 glycosylhydrolase [Verrucomicrobiales bacterium]
MKALSPNPILPGMHPDPTICRVADLFYLATSSFGQFPGVPLYVSEDLKHWSFVRHILSRPKQLPFQQQQNFVSGGIFAPTLRHDGKRFYLVTTNMGNGGHFIVTAENPADEWSDPIWIDEAHQGGIDPSLTFLEDGRVLFQATADPERGEAPGLVQFEIDPLTGRGLTPRRYLSKGFGWKAVEGPHLFQRGEYWYLLTAEGGTEANHRVAIGRSDSPWGPWEACPHNPILTHAGYDSSIQNTGHPDMVSDRDGNWWMVFLGVRPVGYPPVHICGRETYLAPVEWSDGWPVVNGGRPVIEASYPVKWEDRFDGGRPGHPWISIGASYDSAIGTGQASGFYLKPISTSLSDAGPTGFLGTALAGNAVCCEQTVELPSSSNLEGGVCVFMNHNAYYSMGVTQRKGCPVARLTRHVLDMTTVEEVVLESSDRWEMRLELTSGGDAWLPESSSFIFSIRPEGGAWLEVGRGVSRLLATEVVGGFSGLFVGPYCAGRASDHKEGMLVKRFAMAQTD